MVNGIKPNDVEDIRQNIVLHILKHQKAVATLSPTKLNNFIDQAVAKYAKRWKRYRLRFKPMEDDQVPTVNDTRQGELSEYGFTTLKCDVATILEKLTTRQRIICQCLIHDKLPHQIQKMVQCSPSTLTLELDKIRHRFLTFDYC
jgi:hypothetical protein